MKALKEILHDLGILAVEGDTGVMVRHLTRDSREIKPGSAFVAVKGTLADGHDFIPEVVKEGAVAVICEDMPAERSKNVCYVQVKSGARALGLMASQWYGLPSTQIKVIGVTGTNGKTTIATLLYNLFSSLGYFCGLISTVENKIGDEVYPATHTTPDPLQLQAFIAKAAQKGAEFVFMEVSSHAAHQDRIAGIHFTGGIFTNLTRDHLDYHGTFKAYSEAKKKFFDDLEPEAFALLNKDDKNGSFMGQNTRARKYYYSIGSGADFRGKILENTLEGLMLELDGVQSWFELTGTYNAYNLLAIYATSQLLGMESDMVLEALSQLKPPPGRLELFRSDDGVTGIVDYAHTPDALENVLKNLLPLVGAGKIITVIGCGGDRDKGKRPLMAEVAVRLSGQVILTSDNPRSEDPEAILDDMMAGVPVSKRKNVLRIANRMEAIKTASALATKGDMILVAGKGHETYQEIRGKRYDFNDKQVLKEHLGIGIN